MHVYVFVLLLLLFEAFPFPFSLSLSLSHSVALQFNMAMFMDESFVSHLALNHHMLSHSHCCELIYVGINMYWQW